MRPSEARILKGRHGKAALQDATQTQTSYKLATINYVNDTLKAHGKGIALKLNGRKRGLLAGVATVAGNKLHVRCRHDRGA